jgi:DNA-binding IclR family transcriptional regulator
MPFYFVAGMEMRPYQQAFERVRGEFLEAHTTRLTPEQVERQSGVERAICERVLDDLVRAGVLRRSADGSYGRSPETFKSSARDVSDESRLSITDHER